LGASPEYATAAADFATACTRRGLGIVYGGGSAGLMGVLADTALAAGGEVIGVIPQAMITEERAHHHLTQLIPVKSMHERKHRMAQLSDFFVPLPEGIGTLEEVIEIFTWLQLGLHLKPVGLLNVGGFYEPLLQLLDHMCNELFLTTAHRGMLTVERESESLLDRLVAIKHVPIPKSVPRSIDPPPLRFLENPAQEVSKGRGQRRLAAPSNVAVGANQPDHSWSGSITGSELSSGIG
jgi:uncharacterized protein (TIGR00730 family)